MAEPEYTKAPYTPDKEKFDHAVWYSYTSLLGSAEQRGDKKAIKQLFSMMSAYRDSTEGFDRASISQRADEASSKVMVDPLAGFRKGGPGFIPEMLRPMDALPQEERMKTREFQPDPFKGVAGLGRGVTNLIEGSKQVGGHLAEGIGRMTQPDDMDPYLAETNDLMQQEIRQRREREDAGYKHLTRGVEGSMLLSEIVGETAPFLGLPVGRLAGPIGESAPWFARILNPATRALPEVAAGSAEAAIPYAGTEEERGTRAQTGAIGATLGRLGMDYLAKRANARKGVMKTEELQEMHDIGKDYGVPVRSGRYPEQIEAAGQVAEARTGIRTPGALGEEVTADLANEFAAKTGTMDRHYDDIYKRLDEAAGFPLLRDSGGRVMKRGSLDVSPIRTNVAKQFNMEDEFAGMRNEAVMKEYDRWLNMPESLDMSDLHRFRQGLRDRAPRGDKYAEDKFAELDAFISEEMARHADDISPGAGKMLRDMDTWYYEDLPRLKEIPAIRELLEKNPSPDQVLRWMHGAPNSTRREISQMMSGIGKAAVGESFWNQAYAAGTRGKQFNPLTYAKYLEQNLDSARMFLPEAEVVAFENLGKVMRHISGEGAAPDVSLLKLIRGYPFYYRAVADRIRQSNFVYMMGNVPANIRPGSPAMDKWYRSFVRGLMIQEQGEGPTLPVKEGYSALGGPSGQEVGRMAIEQIESLTDNQ